jgi:phosphate starvation-inducible protein PhoH
MFEYIRKLKTKPEQVKKQILAGAMIVSMSFVVLVWFFSLGGRFGTPEVAVKTESDIKPFKQVVVIRTSVQSGREIGFLPGSLDEKMEVFELPYKEICQMLFNRPDAWDRLKEQGYARFITTVALRGISLDDSIIIFDEMQNANWSDVNTVMTRIGNRSKVIFCGDFRQNDLIHSRTDVTAFDDFLKVARRMKSFTEIYYTPDDIVRSNLTKDWIVTCESVNLK